MYDDRDDRIYRRYRNPLKGLATGIFIIGLAFAFYFSDQFGWHVFLPILFAGWAFVSLFAAPSSGNPRGLYSGLHSFTWLMGLALCFWIGFWPWILLPVGVSIILGALYSPITTGLDSSGFMANPPSTQHYQRQYQPYQSYQQGYQPPPMSQTADTYQEGGQQYHYSPQPKQPDDQPPAQPSPQEEIPSQQHYPA
jgi:hypothetical protein